MTDKQLLKTVTGFRKGILSGRPPDGQCYAVSSALCGFLNFGHDEVMRELGK